MHATATVQTHAACLSIKDVDFAYGQRPVLRGISASLHAGRLTCLLGPNAAGKTTMMRLLLGQLEPTRGSVHIDGQPIASWSLPRRAAVVSYVPQRASVSFGYTVEQVVTMGRFALPGKPEVVARAMAQCELTDLRLRIFSQLSVGQQQRVLLARAMAQAADGGRVMLLDEPGSAMDILHVHQMMRQLRALADGGMAVLAIVHDLNLAARYADDVWLLNDGCMVADGRWDEVLTTAMLEPVYRVKLRALREKADHRPVFLVEMDATL
jgi:iron complex transport system ATP-binding protein